jgi:hypothetical protein
MAPSCDGFTIAQIRGIMGECPPSLAAAIPNARTAGTSIAATSMSARIATRTGISHDENPWGRTALRASRAIGTPARGARKRSKSAASHARRPRVPKSGLYLDFLMLMSGSGQNRSLA